MVLVAFFDDDSFTFQFLEVTFGVCPFGGENKSSGTFYLEAGI